MYECDYALFMFLQSLTSRHACIILCNLLWHGYGMAMLVTLSLLPSVANSLQQFSTILQAFNNTADNAGAVFHHRVPCNFINQQ